MNCRTFSQNPRTLGKKATTTITIIKRCIYLHFLFYHWRFLDFTTFTPLLTHSTSCLVLLLNNKTCMLTQFSHELSFQHRFIAGPVLMTRRRWWCTRFRQLKNRLISFTSSAMTNYPASLKDVKSYQMPFDTHSLPLFLFFFFFSLRQTM